MLARFFKNVARSVRRVFRAGRTRTREDGTAAPVYFGAPLVHTSIGSHPFAQLVWFLRVYASEVPGLFRVPGEQEVVDQLIRTSRWSFKSVQSAMFPLFFAAVLARHTSRNGVVVVPTLLADVSDGVVVLLVVVV